jgi:tetratricopeptide (TPR) repeat protein
MTCRLIAVAVLAIRFDAWAQPDLIRKFSGKYDSPEAFRTAESLLQADPSSVPGLFLKARFFISLGEYSRAIPLLERARKAGLGQGDLHSLGWDTLCDYALGEAFFCSGKTAEASEIWRAYLAAGLDRNEQALEIKNPAALFQSACLARLGKRVEAEALVNSVEGLHGSQKYVMALERLRLASTWGDTSKVLATASGICEAFPQALEDADFLADYAQILLACGQPLQAAVDLLNRAAIVDRPVSVANPAFELARLDLAAGKFEAAVGHLAAAWATARRRRPDIRSRQEAELWRLVCQFCTAAGYPDRAVEVARMRSFTDRPPRPGYAAANPLAWQVGAAAIEVLALGDYIEWLNETRPALAGWTWCNSWIEESRCAARKGLLLLRIRRGVSRQLGASVRPTDFLGVANLPVWGWSAMIEALGPGNTIALMEGLPMRSPPSGWVTNYVQILLSRSLGDHQRVVQHGDAALDRLPTHENLVRALVHAIMGEALWNLGRSEASRHMAAAFQTAPAAFRTLRIRLPVNIISSKTTSSTKLLPRLWVDSNSELTLVLQREGLVAGYQLSVGSVVLRTGSSQHGHSLQSLLFSSVALSDADFSKLGGEAVPLE